VQNSPKSIAADQTEDFDRYRHLSACFTCPLRPRCTPTQRRIIKRWENEDVLDSMQARLDLLPDAKAIRRQAVEPPFGTLKAWMGSAHFLTRTLDKVRTEISLDVLAYNMKRVIAIIGVGPLMAAPSGPECPDQLGDRWHTLAAAG
jgi:hypothetical protein